MARTAAKKSKPIKVKFESEAVVTPAAFRTFDALSQLDLTMLKRASEQMIEVGYFETSCCKRMVSAKVKKGMVVKLELERSHGGIAPPPELAKLIKRVITALPVREAARAKLPLPIEDFLADPVPLLIHTWGCVQICIFGYCLTCCYDIGVGKPWGTCNLSLANAPVNAQ